MNVQAAARHQATTPAGAAAWHRLQEKAATSPEAAKHHRETAERLEEMANDKDGYWVRVG
jgi:hypothetical protein